MDDAEIQRKFDNVWEELKLMRKLVWKAVGYVVVGAFVIGGFVVEMRRAVADNEKQLEQKASIEQVSDIERNQKKIAKGVNFNGQVVRAIADKLEIDNLPARPIVDIDADE